MRVLPARLAAGDRADVNCYLAVAARLVALTTVALVAAGLLLRHQLGALLFARPDASRTFALVLGAAAVYSWAMFIICILAAHQATRSVVWATVLSAASTPVVSAIGYTAGGEQATPLILFASSSTSLVTTLLVAFIALHGKLRLGRAGKREGSHARQLLAFSLPKLLGTMSGAITAVAVPVLVGRILGYQDAGQFRAAHTISLAFSSIAVLALFYDFFPRVSAVRDSADKFRRETVEELITMSASSV